MQVGSEGPGIMITSAQMRAARALLGIDQKRLAEIAAVSLPTIQRMEASEGNVRGVVSTLVKVVEAFRAAGVELIGEQARSEGIGRGVRLVRPAIAPGEARMDPALERPAPLPPEVAPIYANRSKP
jgi:transcriptional regulator with XRE-family HTH domain